jgi:hypothetical protein
VTAGPSNRDACSAYRVETGLEIRTSFEPEDIVATELVAARMQMDGLLRRRMRGRSR